MVNRQLAIENCQWAILKDGFLWKLPVRLMHERLQTLFCQSPEYVEVIELMPTLNYFAQFLDKKK